LAASYQVDEKMRMWFWLRSLLCTLYLLAPPWR